MHRHSRLEPFRVHHKDISSTHNLVGTVKPVVKMNISIFTIETILWKIGANEDFSITSQSPLQPSRAFKPGFTVQ